MKTLEDMIGSGSGLYTLSEAARYARMHPITLARWFKGDRYCSKVFSLDDTKVITFLDFMQAIAVRNLRVLYHTPLKDIREAVDEAARKYNISHPFAYKHTTYLYGGKIWIQPAGHPLVQLAGKGRGQMGMTKVIENFYKDISFDPRTGFANSFKAFERAYASGSQKIVMNPTVRFGEPILANAGYTPEALFEAAKTEGSIEQAARSYGVSPDQVRICVEYFDYLSTCAN